MGSIQKVEMSKSEPCRLEENLTEHLINSGFKSLIQIYKQKCSGLQYLKPTYSSEIW